LLFLLTVRGSRAPANKPYKSHDASLAHTPYLPSFFLSASNHHTKGDEKTKVEKMSAPLSDSFIAEVLDDLFRSKDGKPLRKRKYIDPADKAPLAKKAKGAPLGEPKLRCTECKAYFFESKNTETFCRWHTRMFRFFVILCLVFPIRTEPTVV